VRSSSTSENGKSPYNFTVLMRRKSQQQQQQKQQQQFSLFFTSLKKINKVDLYILLLGMAFKEEQIQKYIDYI
jgi:hypothetical protein